MKICGADRKQGLVQEREIVYETCCLGIGSSIPGWRLHVALDRTYE